MIRNNALLFPSEASIRRTIDQHSDVDRNLYADAGALAEGLFGDHMATNLFVLGMAYQAGAVPLKAESIEDAIALNGVAVQQNQQAFRYGRLYVCEPQTVGDLAVERPRDAAAEREHMMRYLQAEGAPADVEAYERLLVRCSHLDEEARRMLARRIGELVDYQDTAYATAYVDFVLDVSAREAAACSGSVELTHAVIRHLYKLMAYKDEYEVARLHLKQAWKAQLGTMFASPQRAYYHLHPPLLRAMGLKRKLKLGPWFDRPLRQLRRLKALRGRWCDPFGYAALRREERRLIAWYRDTVTTLLSQLDTGNHALAVVIANAPEAIRGYEHIKLQRVTETRELVAQHLSRFAATPEAEAVGTAQTS